ncbi:hypothetical protein, partial [Brevibacillus sp. SIMBA_040]|uniref:hypothetical protein n=1 Tax=Brevibacillus sp. SIMBA_040 TaxID=3085781 RepID=UPI00397BE824
QSVGVCHHSSKRRGASTTRRGCIGAACEGWPVPRGSARVGVDRWPAFVPSHGRRGILPRTI